MSNMRIIEPGQQTAEAVAEARKEYVDRFTQKFDVPPGEEMLARWWPLDVEDPADS